MLVYIILRVLVVLDLYEQSDATIILFQTLWRFWCNERSMHISFWSDHDRFINFNPQGLRLINMNVIAEFMFDDHVFVVFYVVLVYYFLRQCRIDFERLDYPKGLLKLWYIALLAANMLLFLLHLSSIIHLVISCLTYVFLSASQNTQASLSWYQKL